MPNILLEFRLAYLYDWGHMYRSTWYEACSKLVRAGLAIYYGPKRLE
jgi:hypothetical protein